LPRTVSSLFFGLVVGSVLVVSPRGKAPVKPAVSRLSLKQRKKYANKLPRQIRKAESTSIWGNGIMVSAKGIQI
jgi:hypothetical protein